MSGTSLDGLDICTSTFHLKDGAWSFEILKAETIPYPSELRDKIVSAYTISSPSEAESIDEELSTYTGSHVNRHITELGVTVDLLGSHGHTVLHEPENGLTFQIGNQPSLRETAGVTTVCDFRVADVELGGQGAPLVPIGDALLFSDYDVCLNLGGFANLSLERDGQRMAWDICPVNIGLNHFAAKMGLDYDANGHIAASNAMDGPTFYHLNQLPYFAEEPPKSLGREWFEKEITPRLDQLSHESALATLTGLAAYQIAKTLEEAGAQNVLCTGGGAYNKHLINMINPSISGELTLPESTVIDYKEALIFGFLALLKMRGENNVLASVTGAEKDHSSGVVYL